MIKLLILVLQFVLFDYAAIFIRMEIFIFTFMQIFETTEKESAQKWK